MHNNNVLNTPDPNNPGPKAWVLTWPGGPDLIFRSEDTLEIKGPRGMSAKVHLEWFGSMLWQPGQPESLLQLEPAIRYVRTLGKLILEHYNPDTGQTTRHSLGTRELRRTYATLLTR